MQMINYRTTSVPDPSNPQRTMPVGCLVGIAKEGERIAGRMQLFASEIGDQAVVYHAQRSYYEELLRAGVRIWLYKAPTVLHAKFFTIDDEVAVVGSSNMDMRSFVLNYEVVMMMTGPEVVARLAQVQDTYRALSTELTLEEWQGRSRGQRYLDNVMRLTATLQ